MAAVDRIEVRGYKSIRAMELDLRALNVFIGANGAGKSNLIQVFTLLNQIGQERLQAYVARSGGANALLHFGRKTTEEIGIRLTFGQNGYEARLAAANDDTLYFAQENCWYHTPSYPEPYIVRFGTGHRETQLFEESRRFPGKPAIADHVIWNIRSWKLYQFHDTSDTASMKLMQDIGDNEFLRPDASNLAAFLYFLQVRHYEYYERIVRTIRLVAPFFGDFNLRPSPLNPDKIQLEWRDSDSDEYFNASALSDGTLRFICLATLLLQPELPSTILIDEPELGLHPYAITLLVSLLRSAATQTQVIVATQSVPLVNQFAPDDVVVVEREGGQSVFRRLEAAAIDTWLDEYGLGDLWEKNVIGGRPQR